MKLLNISQNHLSNDALYGKSSCINSGDIFAISAPAEEGVGKVYIYKKYNEEWQKVQEIGLNSSESPLFGYSIDINNKGNVLAISAPYSDLNRGAVYIYTGEASDWFLTEKIIGNSIEDYLGWDLKLNNSGNRLIIGSYKGAQGNGFAELYEKIGEDWTKIKTFTGSPDQPDQYGFKVAINSGDFIFIGAPGSNGESNGLGEVYVYSEIGNWNLLGKITSNNFLQGAFHTQENNFKFGQEIEVTDDKKNLLISATNDYSGSGKVHLFEYDKSSNFWYSNKNYIFSSVKFTGGASGFGSSIAINNSGNLFFASSSDKTGILHSYLKLNPLVEENKNICYKNVFNIKDPDALSRVITYALRKDDSIVSFGNTKEYGEDVFTGLRQNEEYIQGNVKKVSIGEKHSMILLKNGEVFGLGGSRSQNELQYGTVNPPTGIGFNGNIVDIDCFFNGNMALLKNGYVSGWGEDWRPSNSLENPYNVPSSIQGDVTGITFGGYHALALLKNKRVSGWGSNQFNVLNIPESIQGYVSGIYTIQRATMALVSGGWITGWGYHWNTVSQNISTSISGKVIQASLGCINVFALLDNGNVTGYGNNEYGQLNHFASLSGKVSGISAGCANVSYILKDGRVTGFGYSGINPVGFEINPPICPSFYPVWQKYLKLNNPNPISDGFFGQNISLNRNGDTMIIGDPTSSQAYLLQSPWNNFIEYFGISESNASNYCVCNENLKCKDCCGIEPLWTIVTGNINNLNNLNLEISLSIKNLNCSPTNDIYKIYNISAPIYTDIYKLGSYSSTYTKNISIKNIKPINNLINLEWKVYNLGKEYKLYTGLNINNY